MADEVRLNLQLSQELNKDLVQIAEDTGITLDDVFRQAFALIKVAYAAKREGRHIGLVNDAAKLDDEITGLKDFLRLEEMAGN